MSTPKRPPSKWKLIRRQIPDLRAERDAIMAKRVLPDVRKDEDGCWYWLRHLNREGYGCTSLRRKYWIVSRLVYALYHGPFDAQLDVRHSCDHPACCNPAHLLLGDRTANMRDAVDRRRAKNAKKTHCPQGHPYEGENVRVFVPKGASIKSSYKTWRQCRTCGRERARTPEYRAKARIRRLKYDAQKAAARAQSASREIAGR